MKDEDRTRASDAELVRRFREDPTGQAGRSAAGELFERYWESVYLWCLRRLGSHEAARDIAQEVLISAYQGLEGFEGRSRYSTWLFTIMRNRCFRALRQRGPFVDAEVEVDELAGDSVRIDTLLMEREDEQEILALVRRVLDPTEQSALWLRVFERMPVDEITRRLGIGGASGARGVLQSARRKLREHLKGWDRGRKGTP
jgi:RNA polymerase sigma-70 factor (ECF subfamily)